MNKKRFTRMVKEEIDGEIPAVLTSKDVETIIDIVFGAVTDVLKHEGGKLSVYGFGTFEVGVRKGRTGKLPGGKEFHSKNKQTVLFSPSTTLKREFND